MLELVRREEKSLLERTNLKFVYIYNLSSSYNAYVCINPIEELQGYKQLEKELKKHKSFRIWYSSTSSEDLNTYYYLVNQIYKILRNPIIYVIDISQNNINNILNCTEKEIEESLKYQKQLSNKEIEESINYWNQLKLENGDLRLIKNKRLVSISYEEIDEYILERLSKYEEISIIDFINKELLVPKLFSITDSYGTWNVLIKRLINQNKIRIVRKEYQENLLGYRVQDDIIPEFQVETGIFTKKV